MAELFTIDVQDQQSNWAQLKITSIHPDSGPITDSPGFALMVLYEANGYNELTQTIDFALLLNETWMSDNAKCFIKGVKISKKTKSTAILHIEVTDPKWIAHVKGTKKWESTAFSITQVYNECKTDSVSNDANEGPSASEKTGLTPIWKYFSTELFTSNVPVLWTNTYNQSAYRVDESMECVEVNDATLQMNEGKFVKIGADIGILYKRKNDWGIFEIGGAHTSSTYLNGDKIEFLTFDSSDRFAYPIFELPSFLRYCVCMVFNPSISGDTIELKVLHFNPKTPVSIPSKAYALQLLMRPFEEEANRARFQKGFPLPDFVNEYLDKENRAYFNWEMYLDVVNKEKIPSKLVESIVVEYHLEKFSNGVDFPAIDNLSENELMALYAFDKWPQSTIRIKVSNADFLQGLDQKFPMGFVFNYL